MEPDTIAVTNVRPAFEASLRFGATESEIERACGLTRAALLDDDATVSGDATYAHFELMFGKPSFAQFLVAAAAAHTLSSLGVVGLACKTFATLGEALACHARFGHLTNRTASYRTTIDGDHLVLREARTGAPRLGSLLVSDYAMLIATGLLRDAAPEHARVLALHSRRAQLADDERAVLEAYVGAPIHTGATHAELWLAPELLAVRLPSADPELARYFTAVLERAAGFGAHEDPLLVRLRLAIRDALVHGTPEATAIARALGLGARTLQRRLAALGTSWSDVLDGTRRTLAEGYLRDPSLGLAEIAWLLGYDESTSFFRATRRWFGRTPGELRRGAP
jgi:AraC-like DNA-binding protein